MWTIHKKYLRLIESLGKIVLSHSLRQRISNIQILLDALRLLLIIINKKGLISQWNGDFPLSDWKISVISDYERNAFTISYFSKYFCIESHYVTL